MSILTTLNWRYATKRMTGGIVPQEKVDTILEAIRLSASSLGLQPFNVIVIDNPELKSKIQPTAYNQPQIVESSHLLIFAAWDNVTKEKVDTYMAQIASERGVSVESLAGFRANFEGILNRSAEENYQWAARQAYIALGTGLVAAASEGVDATPMEGFNPAALDELLGLKEKGLRSVLLMPLGYRDVEKDFLASAKKVRRSKEDFFIHL
ncbi:NAD(P)H-dependent oxidoreductase [Arcicella rigui]|uniref:NAD(P)H-dependent oxidoreductase n=1 Tax=Arcicella rigui TaxID=797020 RepID=A0ABU5QCF5_9BACT|nr:NAD(P)H-dependent oxidoreductase [Arcicella rigui]MEA5140534.1 NAD(P)H-dependent oxidoreductase [Arcicella rigui]